MEETLLFTLVYLLFSFGLIYPPEEFVSAGLTIQNLFKKYLGSEKERLIIYHIKKTLLNVFVYSVLPLGYIILLYLQGFVDSLQDLFIGNTAVWKVFAASSICLPIMALFKIKSWTDNGYKLHPIAVNLAKCSNNNTTWEAVAADIETEYRRLEIVSLKTNPVTKVVITENWILKVTPFTILVAHQSEAVLNVKEANLYQLSPVNSSQTQYLNIEVTSNRSQPFVIRINSIDFKDLQDNLARTINVLPEVKFHASVMDQFLEVFKETVEKNPRFHTDMELEQCIGCLQAQPEIKIQKQCQDAANHPNNNCTNCFCRPMWCLDCIGKWFASRQDPETKHRWLSSKCTCPMCRATFCVLDVALLDNVSN